jgi:sugar phosphate isomerase/epimerase
MAQELNDISRLCLHTMTTRPWNLEACIRNYAEAGIHGITIWRNVLENQDICHAATMLDDFGMQVVSLCRGGFFPSVSKENRRKAIDDNLQALEQAAALGAPLIVLVCGADPQQPLEKSRDQIREGILRILPEAKQTGIKLAIEPLHPMYAADRSAINTLRQANDLAQEINSSQVGVAIDVYHLWWDPDLRQEIIRCGENGKILAFHVSDWKVPTVDFLNDRGLMGEGCIDIPAIRSWVESAGFRGFVEAEIFSEAWWNTDQIEYLEKIKHAYLTKT